MKMNLLIKFISLCYLFAKIGLCGFGGGYAMIGMIQTELARDGNWVTARQFTDIVALSQMTPGPLGINAATFVGYQFGVKNGGALMGILGAIAATFSISIISLVLVVAVANFFQKFYENRIVKSIIAAIKPLVFGLIAATSWNFLASSANDDNTNFLKIFFILFTVIVLSVKHKISPVALTLISAILGACLC